MTTSVLLAGSGDDDEQDNTCQSNQEDEADLQGEVDEEISNTDLEDLAAS